MTAQLTIAEPPSPTTAKKQTSWWITHRGPRAKATTTLGYYPPGAAAIKAFVEACDLGKPGTYELRGMASRVEYVMAVGKVQETDMDVAWHPEWCLFSLGAKGMAEEVSAVIAALREEGAWPKEGA